MKPAVIITTTAALLLLAASAKSQKANVEAGDGDHIGLSFGLENLSDRAETIMNQVTEQASTTDQDTAGKNVDAFLQVIRQSEGTASAVDPYAVCYGYHHTIKNFDDHPAVTGEWRGEVLSDGMCANAGFGPGCVSSAAGAYQIIKGTWLRIKGKLGLPDFGSTSQDAAAVELIRARGALEDVKAGRVADAIKKCRNEWASLPGNYAKQGQRDTGTLIGWFQENGGQVA